MEWWSLLTGGSGLAAVAGAAAYAFKWWLILRKTKPRERAEILRAMKGRDDTPDKTDANA